jgi:aminoglycoside phosphotransferase (APT) family kinase protein
MPKGPLISQGRTSEVFSWDENTVLKLFHPQIPQLWIDQERKVGRLVWEAALPVPALQGTVRESDRTGLLLERVRGDCFLHRLISRPLGFRQAAREFTSLHAHIHKVVATDLPPVEVWVSQIILHSPFLSPAEKQSLEKLVDALPAGTNLLHMDFHPGNLIASQDGTKVIDWLMAMRGPPAADVARTLLLLEYHLRPVGMGRFKAWVVRRLLTEFRAHCHDAYLASGISDEDIQAWKLPMAAARINEPIPHEERLALLNYVRSRLADQAA